MNPWYFISLGDGMMAPVHSAEIEERFQAAFLAAGKPPEMAVFVRSKSEDRLHSHILHPVWNGPIGWVVL